MAYNEAVNIGQLLQSLIDQQTTTVVINRILVVSSGSTDATDEIVGQFAQKDSRIELLIQPCREGKASAINCFLSAVKDEIIVMESADTLPTPGTIEALVSIFKNPRVGMVGGHPVPVNAQNTFLGFGVYLLWELHHQVCLRRPKMGELIAFRNIFRTIPNETPVDEASIEPLIIGQGFQMNYAPQAVVYNRGPETIRDYIKQRRRIFSGHIYVRETLGYQVSTLNSTRILFLYLRIMKFLDWRYWVWGPGIIALETFCRLLGFIDYKIRHNKPFNWEIIESTKKLVHPQ